MNTEQLIAELRASLSVPLAKANSVNLATGLVNYDLQKPAKNVYPVNTPLRNAIPRTKGDGDNATRWKVVTSIGDSAGLGIGGSAWVPEGGRAGVMAVNATDKYAGYATFGTEINLTYEAWAAAEGFEDEKARNAIRNLQMTMLKEENAILGGNASVALGTPTAPTVAGAGTGGTIAHGAIYVKVVALTYEGYRNWLATGSAIATGISVQTTVTDPTGATFKVNGGSSAISAASTAATIPSSGTGTVSASTPVVNGAVAYAWYAATSSGGTYTLQTVTTLNSVVLTAYTTSGQNGTAITGDHSQNKGAGGTASDVTAFDGILYATYSSSVNGNTNSYLPGAYVHNQATGNAGVGTKLTASGKGTVNEIDAMLISMWNNYQVSPDVIYVNAQQLQDITTLCLTGSSAPLLTYFADPQTGYQKLSAGGVIEFYFNPFTMGGGTKIPIMIHPTVPPGVIVAWAKNLPAQYQAANVPNAVEVHYRRDYYQIDWPARTRLFESGIYAEETLAVYAPFACGLIGNIGPGV